MPVVARSGSLAGCVPVSTPIVQQLVFSVGKTKQTTFSFR
jgi:hypothetical protein